MMLPTLHRILGGILGRNSFITQIQVTVPLCLIFRVGSMVDARSSSQYAVHLDFVSRAFWLTVEGHLVGVVVGAIGGHPGGW